MSRTGDCYDNAVMEAFFSTVKTELADAFVSHGQAKRELFEDVEAFYNTGGGIRPSTTSVPPNSSDAFDPAVRRSNAREVVNRGDPLDRKTAQDAAGAIVSRGALLWYPSFSTGRMPIDFRRVSPHLRLFARSKTMWTLPPLWTHRTRPRGSGNLATNARFPQIG
jgi:hypothetical protein